MPFTTTSTEFSSQSIHNSHNNNILSSRCNHDDGVVIISKRTIQIFTCLSLLLLLTNFGLTMVEANKQKDGKIAQKLDEYHSTIKCVINIAEETLPGNNIECC